MRRLIRYLIVFISIGTIFLGKSFAIPMKNNGQGDLVLSDEILEKYYLYINTKSSDNPLNFFITEDHKNVFIQVRKNTSYKGYSGSGPIARNLKKCEDKYKQKCFLFSNQRFVVWDNGINPIDAKKSKIKRKISYDEFIIKLKDLGFYDVEKRIVENNKITKTNSDTKNKKDKIKVAKEEPLKIENDQEQKKINKVNKKSIEITQKPIKEFKPKNKSIDNDPPIIEIAEKITVNNQSFEFQGKVMDKAELIFVEVDGRPVKVIDGNFTVKGYSPIDKEISIEAIDKWGNRSEPKIVEVLIDIKNTDFAEKLEPLNPLKIESQLSANKVALIIGIENYSDIVKASFAKADAQYFREYAYKGLGIENKNIKLLLDEEATFIEINKVLKKWLVSKIKPNQTELVIYYAGHGLASKNGEELYLLPQDGDPDLLSISSISRSNLFSEIQSLNPKSVTIFLDACYSGSSRDNEILLADARPVRIVAEQNEDVPENFTIFSASQLDQISSGLKEINHGIFSYYLMKGLEGKADFNKDNRITNGELLAYMDKNVSEKASELGRKQNPALLGDPNKVLMSYSEILK
ncbi:caspase family protein [Candidatus Pelagibacter sp.]|uniref:caspase family protein n=1 Tax=Candidatus Pelagibacter sp. TaxID=2024849 RepID=UPI003F82DDDC